MQQYRYPGSRPFTTEDRNLFFGRDDDIEKLRQLISLENLVVLYGKSGLGKTSLLNAGVIPQLKEQNNYETMMIRLGSYVTETSISPLQTLTRNLQASDERENFIYSKLINPEDITSQRLWYLFKNLQINQPQKEGFIVVFDQFEELFTYPDAQVEEFKKEVAELINMSLPQQLRNILREQLIIDKDYLSKEEALFLYKPINLKIVFSIRSDKLSLMNRLTDYLPNILKKYYELLPLSSEQAIKAIVNPAQLDDQDYWSPKFSYSAEALNEIIRFLSKGKQETIETFLLQIVCHYVETVVQKSNLNTVKLDDLGDLQNISKNFYHELIGQLNTADQLPARIFIEEGLIFEEDQRRLSLYEGQIFRQYGISKDVLQKLLDSHLLRSEPFHSGGFTYELSHDTLIIPILEAKTIRKQEEARQKERTRQQEEVHQFLLSRFSDFKNRSILLQEADLQYLAPYEEKLSLNDEQKKFIEKSKRSVRQSKNRNRNIVLGAGAGLGLLVLLSVFAYFLYRERDKVVVQKDIAENQTRIANEQTKLAEEKTLEAEREKNQADSLRTVAQTESQKAVESEKKAMVQKDLAITKSNYAIKSGKEALHQKALADSANTDMNNLVNSSSESIKSSTEIIRQIKMELDKEQKGTQTDSMTLIKITSILSINGAKIIVFQKGYITGLYMFGSVENPYNKSQQEYEMWQAGFKFGQIEARKSKKGLSN